MLKGPLKAAPVSIFQIQAFLQVLFRALQGYGLYRFRHTTLVVLDKVNRWVLFGLKTVQFPIRFCPNKITLEKFISNAIHVGKSVNKRRFFSSR
jgi:hypothetical protein